MRVMSMTEGAVPEAQRFFPLQVEHAAPHLTKKRPATTQETLDAVMAAMHNRHHTKPAVMASPASSRAWHAMSTNPFLWTGLSVQCAITSVTFTSIVCFTESTGLLPSNFTSTGYSSIVGLVHVNINQIDTICATSDPSQSCLYGFDVNHTPAISSVTPTSGGAGTVITITGSLLNSKLDVVLIGYDTCTNVVQTASAITCTVPGNTAATVPVQVLFSSYGFAANTSLLTFSRTLFIAELSQASGSYGGGTKLTLTGSGFSPVPTDNTVTIGTLPAIVVSSSATQLVITTPPATYATADTTSTLTLTVAGFFYAAYTYPNVNAPSVYPVLGSENPAMTSTTSTTNSFIYTTSLTPTLTAVTPQSGQSGTVITVTGTGFTAATTVEIGGVQCTGITGQTATTLSCTVQTSPAGVYPVNVIVPGQGLAYVTAANVATTMFTSALTVTGISPLVSGYGGGVNITLSGSGFGTLGNQSIVQICNTNCSVVSATYNQLVCTTDALSTLDRIQKYGPTQVTIAQPFGGAQLIGFLGFNTGSTGLSLLFDDDPQTGVVSDGTCVYPCVSYAGIDMGPASLLALTQVRWYAPYGAASSTVGGQFQSSMDGQTWSTIFAVAGQPTEGWNYVTMVPQGAGSTVAPITSAQRFFRFISPPGAGQQLRLQEMEFSGYRVASVNAALTNNDVTQCPVTVTVVAQDPLESLQLDGAQYTNAVLQTSFTVGYTLGNTPTITNIVPNNGSSLGGTSITLTGTGFSGATASTQVALSGYPCLVTSASSTQVVCTTTARSFIGMSPTGTQISLISGANGRALLVQQGGVAGVPLVNPVLPLFRYLDRWSQVNTWQYDEPPLEGDTVVIPQGQTILMDVSPPTLLVLLVQGVLVWDIQDSLTLDATYIWVNGGTFQIGTEQQPFPYNATITLHGDRYSTIELPFIGSKCLAVDGVGMGIFGTTYAPFARYGPDANGGARSDYYDNMNGVGVLDIHGIPRMRVWTKVTPNTYAAGSLTIHTDEAVDFQAGEILVLTDSSWAHNVEEVVVASLSADGKTITLQQPLTLSHTSERYTVQGRDVDMRAQIAILSRNIVIQGDELSEPQQYGSHVMMMAGSIMRVENIETRRCGQGFNLGRYCLHFHMAGDVSKSYLKSNSIHNGYQRASTTHGVEYATVFNEVAYLVKGHNFFIEDGSERQNVFEANLAINVLPLTTMLQSDLSPAAFWTSTPANTWIHNVVSGTPNSGIWFETVMNPTGPSTTTALCPCNMAIGQFYNNSFSHGSVGVQVYASLTPSTNPCGGGSPAYSAWELTTAYRLGNAFNLKHIGPNVQVLDAVMAECNQAIQWTNVDGGYIGAEDQLVNALVIGSVTPGSYQPDLGIWMPQNEYVRINGATFVNFPSNAAAILMCFQCSSIAQLSQGGFTMWTQNLSFVNTPTRWASAYPYKEIIFDFDGSLTGIVNGSLTPSYGFNVNPHCKPGYAGLVCDASVRVRRLVVMPTSSPIVNAFLLVTSFDSTGALMGTDTLPYYPADFSGWVVPVVTGYTYSFNFTVGGTSLDFSVLDLSYSTPSIVQYNSLGAANEWVLLKFPYSTYRWEFEVDYPGTWGGGLAVQTSYGNVQVPWNNYSVDAANGCAPSWQQPFGTGCNDRVHQSYQLILNTNGNPVLGGAMYTALVQALECPYSGCIVVPPPTFTGANTTFGPWSDAATWAAMNMTMPAAGATFTIPSTAWVVYDLDTAPVFNEIIINGKVSFDDTNDRELVATRILVTGDLEIGSAAQPFQHRAAITLVGDQTSPILLVNNYLGDSIGNKVLAVLGNASFHGTPIVNTWTAITATAGVGATSITVADSVSDWAVGSTIVISSTEYDSKQREQLTITAVSGNKITFTPALVNSHFGGLVDYSATGNVFFGAKVGLLDRNIVVRGNMTSLDVKQMWGAHIVVSEIPATGPTSSYLPAGRLDFSYVQLDHVGQSSSSPAVLLHYFTGADNPSNEFSVTYWSQHPPGGDVPSALAASVTRMVGCSLSNVYGQGVYAQGAINVVLQNNVLDTTYTNALKFDSSAVNSVVTGNLMINAQRAPTDIANNHHPIAAMYMMATPLAFSGNVVAGANDSALVFTPASCGSTVVFSFEAHSSPMGVWMLPGLSGSGCVQLNNVKLWKHSYIAVYTVDQDYNLIFFDNVIADSHEGIHFNGYSGSSGNAVEIVDSILFGTTATSTCAQSLQCYGVAHETDFLGTSATCASTFGPSYRHVGIVSHVYSDKPRLCGYGGGAQGSGVICDPINTVGWTCGLPLDNRYGLPSSPFGSMYITNVTFAYWTNSECNGMRTAALAYNPASETFSAEMWASQITWWKSDMEARINMQLTPASVNCQTGCDGFDNFVINDVDGTLLANTAGAAAGNVVVTQGSSVVTNNPACSYQKAWGGYICLQQQWRLINIWINNSPDRVNPAQTTTLVSPSLNVTSFSVGPIDENCALSMYFPTIQFLAMAGVETDVVPGGTMPASALISVHSQSASEQFLLTIFYTQPMQMLAYTSAGQLGNQLTTRLPLVTDPAGTFSYNPQLRKAYVVLAGGSGGNAFTLAQSGLISVTMGLAVDFATFDGANVVYYMALLLGIDPSTIKVADVHAGSTIASYYIAGSPNVTGNATLNAAYLNTVAKNLVTIVQSGAFTQATGYTVTSLTVTPPTVDGNNNTIVYNPSGGLSSADVAGIATGVIAGVVIAVIIVLLLALLRRSCTSCDSDA